MYFKNAKNIEKNILCQLVAKARFLILFQFILTYKITKIKIDQNYTDK